MVRRSHKRRKRFACGHLGYGRWCHRCARPKRRNGPNPSILVDLQQPATSSARAAMTRSRQVARQQVAKRRWQQQFLDDPIPLTHLPKPVVIKTRLILGALRQGRSPADLRGKRFNFDRTLLRIPVTYRYRLLCRWQNGQITPLRVMSHEAYNTLIGNKKRVSGL